MSRTEGSQFFVAQKRNEVSELKALFRHLPTESPNYPEHTHRRREALKKLIFYMSLGIDVSSLFPDVVLASVTPDVIQKKLISIYLNNYADKNSETAILVINAYQKDLHDADPRIRGIALKCLSSLRTETVEEYAKKAIQDGLNDPSCHVKNLAVIGVLKLNQVEDSLKDSIEGLLTNPNTSMQVLITALIALTQLYGTYGLSRDIMIILFNKLSECSGFEKCVVLKSLSTYVPSNENELLGLLETLEPYLSTTTASLVISTLHCMLALIREHEFAKTIKRTNDWLKLPLTLSVIARSAPSLITLLTSSSNEVNYGVLTTIDRLINLDETFADMFAEYWVWLIPKHMESVPCRVLKLQITNKLLEDKERASLILDSIPVLVPLHSVPREVSDAALMLYETTCLRHPSVSEQVFSQLFEWFSLEIPDLCASLLPVLAKLILRNQEYLIEFGRLCNSLEDYIQDLDDASVESLMFLAGLDPLNFDVSTIFDHAHTSIFGTKMRSTELLVAFLSSSLRILTQFPSIITERLSIILQLIQDNWNEMPLSVMEQYLITARLIGREHDLLKKVYGKKPKFEVHRRQKIDCSLDTLTACNSSTILVPFGGVYTNPLPQVEETLTECDRLEANANANLLDIDSDALIGSLI